MSSTLPDLLRSRAQASSAEIGFLDMDGNVTNSLTCRHLFDGAKATAQSLVSLGLRPGEDVVMTCFSDHESHIRLFWGCCLAGIVICPLPSLHPDPACRTALFTHLQHLFKEPVLIANEDTITEIHQSAPSLRAISLESVDGASKPDAGGIHVYPARQPKPDDIVCLMLTSGSTGNSKAVALRHSNLLSSIRGKIGHHGTTRQSRFLNWIAFDHVACLSEVHLQALEADASQYHVAPSAIVRKPWNLLEWCSRLRISYSFSPNFLLAQICREAVALLPADGSLDLRELRAFISGGEAVPVKTAITFSDIIERFGAPRSTLRAGFGMSETGAGCIYDRRPIVRESDPVSQKYLSLGTCCNGVAMRVVSPVTGQICGPFMAGHLQLKGASVFCEYFNNASATSDSFSDDGWFITGDNAMIDDEGNLHLVGREKDYFNTNGVKHPCIDVEHYIEDSRIDGIMPSFVYVCPMRLADSDTETYAVFYQHHLIVENELSEQEMQAITETTLAIKNVCIVFALQAPSVILPLPRQSFSKTALGKVSRSALAAAYAQGTHAALEEKLKVAAASAPSTQRVPESFVERIVIEEISAAFDVPEAALTGSQNLYELGASSMHLMRLKHVLQTRLGLPDIPTIDMLRRPQIDELCKYLCEKTGTLKGKTHQSSYNPLVCLNPSGSKPPIFLVHPGVGEVLVFLQLAYVLNDDRPVYALRARGFDEGETTFESFDEMVRTYSAALEVQFPHGPYYIGGYSFGGAVAFEMGKLLESKGKSVAWIGILNLPPHIKFRMEELTWSEVFLNLLSFLSLVPYDTFDKLKIELLSTFPAIESVETEPENSVEIISWLLKRSDQDRVRELKLTSSEFLRWSRVAYGTTVLGKTFEPRGAVRNALTTVFCAVPLAAMGNREQYKQNHLAAWKGFSGERLEFVDVDGEHYTMLDSNNVLSFAERLRAALLNASRSDELSTVTTITYLRRSFQRLLKAWLW